MRKRFIACISFVLILFSLFASLVAAEKPGTCGVKDGVNYCGGKSKVSDCYCDNVCTNLGDCCTNYSSVCSGSGNISVTSKCFDTDGGVYYFNYGYVNYTVLEQGTIIGQSILTLNDYCTIGQSQDCYGDDYGICYDHVGSCKGDNCYIIERFCDGSTPSAPAFQYYKCPNGCKDGACIPSSNKQVITKQDVIDWINTHCS